MVRYQRVDAADAADDADDHRQDQELRRIQPAAVAGDRHQVPDLGHQPLAADDVEQAGDRHHRHAEHDAGEIQRRGAEEHQQQGKGYRDEQAEDEGRHGDGQARPHARADLARDVAAVVGAAEVAGEHAHRLAEEDRVGEAAVPCALRIPHQRLVVAALGLPLLDRLRRHALDAELHARHVVRRVHHEEQGEGEQIHADQDRNRIQQAADDVGEHGDGLSGSAESSRPKSMARKSLRIAGENSWRLTNSVAAPAARHSQAPDRRDRRRLHGVARVADEAGATRIVHQEAVGKHPEALDVGRRCASPAATARAAAASSSGAETPG
jgi:hypothetical protein